MRFVDRDLSDVPVLHVRQKTVEHQALRRDIEQSIFAVDASPRKRAVRLRSRSSVELRNVAAIPLACSASTWSFINEISGETTTVRPSRSKRRQLKTERFAAAGRHQSEDVAPGQRIIYDFTLEWSKCVVGAMRFQRIGKILLYLSLGRSNTFVAALCRRRKPGPLCLSG